ncbi:hypothetical protein APHAL10511_004186 [Amanita phalloides]|nr:hypothetical protein APHAL10511_004186 [Amanita phalloides]
MPRQSQTATARGQRLQEHKCCGIVEETKYHVKTRREARTKRPWIVLKFMVLVTAIGMAYTAYVYVGRFCVPFIKRPRDRATGIVLLILFVILFFWMLWGYMKVVLTSPGYARDHVPRTPQPISSQTAVPLSQLPMSQRSSHDSQRQGPISDQRIQHRTEPSLTLSIGEDYSRQDDMVGPSYENILLRTGVVERTSDQTEEQTNALETLPRPAISVAPAKRKLQKLLRPGKPKNPPRPKIYIARRPPMTPMLLPENRYCRKDDIVKPYRAHHCRYCGTCVLRYDHHCPWIGQCVGARNHKFFVNFTSAAAIYCAYVFSTLVAYTVHDAKSLGAGVDPQVIAVIALTFLFGLFLWTLTVSHIMLILGNQTTIESMLIRRMKEREAAQLNKAFACYDLRSKRYMQKEWDREWGDLETEGHLWWIGDRRTAWTDVMGNHVCGWFLPISHGLNDGLLYPVNPRFDSEGRWRRRSDWPKGFQ